jgi:cell division protein FtsW (lipid II flippase)
MVMAGVLIALAYLLASLGSTAEIPARIGPFLVVVLGVLATAHLTTRRWARHADPLLLPLAAMLNGLGYVMIARLSDRLAGLQATWTVVGITAFVLTLFTVRRIGDLTRYRWTLLAGSFLLLLLPLVPGLGYSSGGARIWVRLGSVTFQPGEFAKVALAVFFAAYLAERRELIAARTWRLGPLHLPEPVHLLPIVMAWAGSVGIMVLQRDLGSSLLFFTLLIVMLWVATDRTTYLVGGFALFGVAAVAAYHLFDHVQTRVTVWLDPWSDFYGKGYQLAQASFALAEGGLSGTGLGLGDPQRIPLAQNDFIFAALGEELGLFGATLVLVSYLLIVGTGLRAATRAGRADDALLAVGLSAIVGVQAFIIIAGVIRVLPLTGVTLPFVSYGGSSLVANYVLLALLIRISDGANRRVERTA